MVDEVEVEVSAMPVAARKPRPRRGRCADEVVAEYNQASGDSDAGQGTIYCRRKKRGEEGELVSCLTVCWAPARWKSYSIHDRNFKLALLRQMKFLVPLC